MVTRKTPILPLRKENPPLYSDHQALEPLIKKNRSKKLYGEKITRWLDRLTHTDISIQHFAGRNLTITDYRKRNLVGRTMPEKIYDEKYVITCRQAEANLKDEQLIADQSNCNITLTERNTNKEFHSKTEHKTDQSQSNGLFENANHVNENQENETTTSVQSIVNTLKDSQ